MTEKRQVLYDLRYTYSGSFSVEDFYAYVDQWIYEKGLEKEHKKKLEHVTKDGKKIEWVIEVHWHIDDLHYGIVVLRALFDNVRESVIKKDGRKIRLNNGDVYINIDGFIQSQLHGSFYQSKPVFTFIRTIIDLRLWNFWMFSRDGKVSGNGHDLFKGIRMFFDEQRKKYI